MVIFANISFQIIYLEGTFEFDSIVIVVCSYVILLWPGVNIGHDSPQHKP